MYHIDEEQILWIIHAQTAQKGKWKCLILEALQIKPIGEAQSYVAQLNSDILSIHHKLMTKI